MFDLVQNKHCSFEIACRRFADAHNLNDIAITAGINTQVLRNKLNPEQPHRLTVDELISLTQSTNSPALIDGVLAQLNKLPSVSIPQSEQTHLPTCAMSATAATGALCGETVKLMNGEKLTRERRNAILERASAAIRDLSLIMIDVESKFNAVPIVTAALDIGQCFVN